MIRDMDVEEINSSGNGSGNENENESKDQIQNQQQQQTFLVAVSFRGVKIETEVSRSGEMSVGQLKEQLLERKNLSSSKKSSGSNVKSDDMEVSQLSVDDIKLMHGGKVLDDVHSDIYTILSSKYKTSTNAKAKRPKKVTFLATGLSSIERQKANNEIKEGMDHSTKLRLVKDDLSKEGQAELRRRKRVGQKMLTKAATRANAISGERSPYVFGRIETLPNLPEEDKARSILTMLSQDKGVLACMAKHKWTVGCLAELKPDGRVGQDPVCVMGLNENKGQKILLRLRTDDFKGFRKILSIRKVLYHELAHNVHSDHDDKFFQLMRQIEKECTDPNIVGESGQSLSQQEVHQPLDNDVDMEDDFHTFEGRTGKLGGANGGVESKHATNVHDGTQAIIPPREMAARAAMSRLGVHHNTSNIDSTQIGVGGTTNKGNQVCSCGASHSASSKEQKEHQCKHKNHNH